jgi:hypothetical protein
MDDPIPGGVPVCAGDVIADPLLCEPRDNFMTQLVCDLDVTRVFVCEDGPGREWEKGRREIECLIREGDPASPWLLCSRE